MAIVRFLFLNIYAFVLLILGIGAIFISSELFILIIKFLIAIVLIGYSISIFLKYKRKKRMIKVLLERNRNGFVKDSFKPYMETLCTQLVVIYVLNKIGYQSAFKMLFEEYWKDITDD
jgi:hypothetical protein